MKQIILLNGRAVDFPYEGTETDVARLHEEAGLGAAYRKNQDLAAAYRTARETLSEADAFTATADLRAEVAVLCRPGKGGEL